MYSKKWINTVSLILATIIFFSINMIWGKIETISVAVEGTKEETKTTNAEEKVEINQEEIIENTEENQTQNQTEEKDETWKIEIPSISLIANIAEGTEESTLNKYVGHFTITPKKEGNIGLAAHNRGYPVNYFANLKKLKGGEEIIYTYHEITKTYIVTQNIKISDIDWSYLENSNENKLTLITCIANEPAYRRCVQAIEKEERILEKTN